MSPEATFKITELKRDEQSVSLHVEGDLTVDNSPRLKDALKACFSQNLKRIQVVLEGVAKIDSSGVATLVEGLRWSRASERQFVLSGLTEAVLDRMEMSKLDSEFEILAEADS